LTNKVASTYFAGQSDLVLTPNTNLPANTKFTCEYSIRVDVGGVKKSYIMPSAHPWEFTTIAQADFLQDFEGY
jgi:hypothetical protein